MFVFLSDLLKFIEMSPLFGIIAAVVWAAGTFAALASVRKEKIMSEMFFFAGALFLLYAFMLGKFVSPPGVHYWSVFWLFFVVCCYRSLTESRRKKEACTSEFAVQAWIYSFLLAEITLATLTYALDFF